VEERLTKALGIFSALAICIACLGLFGLAAYTAEQRTKEIGIRKVLGASISGIVGLLSSEVFISRCWWVFALAGGMVLLIALLTVSTQAIKAALANPVESLRYE
jgi:putative ABC transport system permease protein